MMNKAKLLRLMLEEAGVVRIVGAHNGMGAKLIEKNGFDGIWASGFEISSSFGVPDANILSMSQMIEAATNINDATSLPVILDADTGYGNVNNVMYLVHQLEKIGISGMVIEDKLFPKVNSFVVGRQELTSITEFTNKIRSAKEAQSNDLVVFARVEALIAGLGMEEAVKRAKEYALAGADGIFIHSKRSTSDEIIEFIKKFDLNVPIVVCPTTYPTFTLEEVKKYPSIKMVIYANQGIRASIKAMNHVFEKLNASNDLTLIEEDICKINDVFEIQGMHKLKENEKKFLFDSAEKINVIIPAAGKVNDEQLRKKFKNMSVCMIKIGGKTILERDIETLNAVGLQDITVVTGENSEKISADGVNIFHNPNYKETHILDTIFQAQSKLYDSSLIIYSDILFEKEIIYNLLHTAGDIVIVVDSAFRSYKRIEKFTDREIVLVKTCKDTLQERRFIHGPNHVNKVLAIGKKISMADAHYEYIGIAYFTKKGAELLRKYYCKERSKYVYGKFNEAENFSKANLYDLLQKMIDNGVIVNVYETYNGWTEINSLDDYERTEKQLIGV